MSFCSLLALSEDTLHQANSFVSPAATSSFLDDLHQDHHALLSCTCLDDLHRACPGSHQMESSESTSATKDQSCSAKSMAGLLQEGQLLLHAQLGAIVLCNELQVKLDFVDVLPNRLWHQWKVIMELTAQTAAKSEQLILQICLVHLKCHMELAATSFGRSQGQLPSCNDHEM